MLFRIISFQNLYYHKTLGERCKTKYNESGFANIIQTSWKWWARLGFHLRCLVPYSIYIYSKTQIGSIICASLWLSMHCRKSWTLQSWISSKWFSIFGNIIIMDENIINNILYLHFNIRFRNIGNVEKDHTLGTTKRSCNIKGEDCGCIFSIRTTGNSLYLCN
jgi:hypothetical protein